MAIYPHTESEWHHHEIIMYTCYYFRELNIDTYTSLPQKAILKTIDSHNLKDEKPYFTKAIYVLLYTCYVILHVSIKQPPVLKM